MKTEIIFEDQDLLVCYKPAGFPAQTKNALSQDLVSECRNYLFRETGERNPYLGLIQRLDQPVEGLLVLAKNKRTASVLEKQLQDGSLKKTYVAVLRGSVSPQKADLTDYLKRGANGNALVTHKGDAQAKEARLSYQIISEKEDKSLAKINLYTGRYHQIRVQMAHMKHPILGDFRYGKEEENRRGFTPLALCACCLDFVHPVTNKPMHMTVMPKGAYFRDFLVDISTIIA